MPTGYAQAPAVRRGLPVFWGRGCPIPIPKGNPWHPPSDSETRVLPSGGGIGAAHGGGRWAHKGAHTMAVGVLPSAPTPSTPQWGSTGGISNARLHQVLGVEAPTAPGIRGHAGVH